MADLFTQIWTSLWQKPLPLHFQSYGPWRLDLPGLFTEEPILRSRCAIPDDVPCYRLTIDAPLGMRGYSVSIFGYPESSADPPNTAPRFTIMTKPDCFIFLVMQRCVRHVTTPLWLEELWRPETDLTLSIHGLEQRHTQEDVDRIWRGRRILRALEKGGRPPGITNLTAEEFRSRYPHAYHRAQQRHGQFPSQAAVAKELWLSHSTFKRYLQSYKCDFPPR